MGKICAKRVLLGGLLAGLIINLIEFIVSGVILHNDWVEAMKALNKPADFGAGQILLFNGFGFAMGILMIWLYAAIRPRFGPGPKTAIQAAQIVWLLGYLAPAVFPLSVELFPLRLYLIGLAVGLVETIAGALAGACIYREEATGAH